MGWVSRPHSQDLPPTTICQREVRHCHMICFFIHRKGSNPDQGPSLRHTSWHCQMIWFLPNLDLRQFNSSGAQSHVVSTQSLQRGYAAPKALVLRDRDSQACDRFHLISHGCDGHGPVIHCSSLMRTKCTSKMQSNSIWSIAHRIWPCRRMLIEILS
jgi:hypothetical protein